MKKGVITNIGIYKNYGVHYDGYIDFRVGDNYYHCSNIDAFIKAYSKNRSSNIEEVKGSDFKVFAEYKKDDGILFEIQLQNHKYNPNKTISYIYGEI